MAHEKAQQDEYRQSGWPFPKRSDKERTRNRTDYASPSGASSTENSLRYGARRDRAEQDNDKYDQWPRDIYGRQGYGREQFRYGPAARDHGGFDIPRRWTGPNNREYDDFYIRDYGHSSHAPQYYGTQPLGRHEGPYSEQYIGGYDGDMDTTFQGHHGGWDQGSLSGNEAQTLHSRHIDPDYHQWRNEQIRLLDRDYDDYRQERYQKFIDEFGKWRSERSKNKETANPDLASSASENNDDSATAKASLPLPSPK